MVLWSVGQQGQHTASQAFCDSNPEEQLRVSKVFWVCSCLLRTFGSYLLSSGSPEADGDAVRSQARPQGALKEEQIVKHAWALHAWQSSI